MSLARGEPPDDHLLVRYLIGSLPDDEAERLDELSITSDDVAMRLRALEHDLVDAYVKGELSGETLDLFRSHYLSSPAKRERVRFAQTLLAYRTAPAAASTTAATSIPRRSAWPRAVPLWALAAAALLFLAASGYLLTDNVRLQREIGESRHARAAADERERQLQQQLADQQAANSEAARELARARDALAQRGAAGRPQSSGGGVLSFVLLPMTRGANDLPTISIPRGTAAVTLRPTLDVDEYPRYQIALIDPAANRIVSRAANLRATSSGGTKSLSIIVAANLLKPQVYRIDVSGVPASGAAELIASYSFAVAIR